METVQETLKHTELIPYSTQKNTCKLNNQFERNALKSDALQAVKLDPAVLEARVTIKTSENINFGELCEDNDIASKGSASSSSASFEDAVMQQQAALLSLSPELYQLLLSFVSTLKRQRKFNQINLECAFCKNNGQSVAWYSSHALRNWRGRVQCPVLRAYQCPRCGATGDWAHTVKYCGLDLYN